MALPKQKRRTVCGWRFGSAASLTITKTTKWGPVCRRCFLKGGIEMPVIPTDPIEVLQTGNESPIEQYDD